MRCCLKSWPRNPTFQNDKVYDAHFGVRQELRRAAHTICLSVVLPITSVVGGSAALLIEHQ
jgi:hypothetical protein